MRRAGFDAVKRDHLTEGIDIAEEAVLPSDEEADAALDLEAPRTGPGAYGVIDRLGIPRCFPWTDGDDTIDFDEAFRAAHDSVQVFVDDQSVLTSSAARGCDASGAIPERSPPLVELRPREKRILVEMFEGGTGDSGSGSRTRSSLRSRRRWGSGSRSSPSARAPWGSRRSSTAGMRMPTGS